MLEVEGILKLGDTLEFEIKDGEILNCGRKESSYINIPIEEIDDEQFKLMNFRGNLYLIDCSNKYPTRIKVEAGKFYALNQGDFINLGLEEDFDLEVIKCTNRLPPAAHKENFINIRYVPPELNSKTLNEFIHSD